jgi:uncharacterized membrane protein YphA (DoxX/SURF4 family)
MNKIKALLNSPYLILALRLFFGIIFIYAAYDKLLNPLEFSQAVENYQLVNAALSKWIAIWLPFLELILGIMLLFNIWLVPGTIINVILNIVFTIAVFSAYYRGLDISCGCFGKESGIVTGSKVFSNIMLLAISLFFYALVFRKTVDK